MTAICITMGHTSAHGKQRPLPLTARQRGSTPIHDDSPCGECITTMSATVKPWHSPVPTQTAAG
jgi:hypothetical protein